MNTLHNLQGEAGQLLDALKECSAQANAVSQRWFTLAQMERLTLAQAAAYAQLEPTFRSFASPGSCIIEQ